MKITLLTYKDCRILNVRLLKDKLEELGMTVELSRGMVSEDSSICYRFATGKYNSLFSRVVRLCELRNIPIVNPYLYDKWDQYELMKDLGIPTPYTEFYDHVDEIEVDSFPIVIKPLSKMNGIDVYLVKSKEELRSKWKSGVHKLVQEYIPSGHRTIKAFVVGDIISEAYRCVGYSGFVSNPHHGMRGYTEPFEASDELINFVMRVCKGTKIDVASLDIAETENGPTVFEINHNYFCFYTHKEFLTCLANYLKDRGERHETNIMEIL